MFRPFPARAVRDLAASVDRLGVMDRSYTFGSAGPAATEVAAALYASPHRPTLSGFLAGIGGRDVTPGEVRRMFGALLAGEPSDIRWIDLEEQAELKIDG